MNGEKALRRIIRKKVEASLKEEMKYEFALRKVIRKLLKEGDLSDIHPHRSTGINALEDVLKKSIPKGLPPVETAIRIKEQGGLVSIPHPFDRFRGQVISKKALNDLVNYADIVEVFNSRNNLSSDDKKAQKFATKHDLLTSGVSDAHTIMELGRTYIEMPGFDGTPDGFKIALSNGEIVSRRMNPLIHIVTTFTKIKKKLKSRFRHHPNK